MHSLAFSGPFVHVTPGNCENRKQSNRSDACEKHPRTSVLDTCSNMLFLLCNSNYILYPHTLHHIRELLQHIHAASIVKVLTTEVNKMGFNWSCVYFTMMDRYLNTPTKSIYWHHLVILNVCSGLFVCKLPCDFCHNIQVFSTPFTS